MQSQTLQPFVRLLVLLLALGSIFLLIGGPAEAEAPVETVEYVVDAGDTLWNIAKESAAPELDTRAAVLTIQDINGLDSGVIHPGQVILVPKG